MCVGCDGVFVGGIFVPFEDCGVACEREAGVEDGKTGGECGGGVGEVRWWW